MTIAGNSIGTDPGGTLDFGNAGDGIRLLARTSGVSIGGPAAVKRNVISGNNGDGVEINGATTGNTVQGNYIGVNAAGGSTSEAAVAWYRADNSTFNVPNGQSGTLTNGATYATGLVGAAAFSFDGVNDYVNVPNNGLQNGHAAYTLESWINPTSFAVSAGSGPLIVGKNGGYQLLLLTDGRLHTVRHSISRYFVRSETVET